MGFQKLPSNSRALLGEIVSTDNPVSLLCDKSKKASPQQYQELRGILRELQEKGYLEVLWANNKPYHVTVNNSARTYEEQLAEYEAREQVSGTQNITIGSNNKIKNSTIAGIINANGADTSKGFYEKHPVFCSVLISFLVGSILLFSFWDQVISFIEGLF